MPEFSNAEVLLLPLVVQLQHGLLQPHQIIVQCTLTSSHDSGDTFPVGSTTVTYTATDGSGNETQDTFTITVTDNEDPVIADCPADITQDSDAGVCEAVVTWAAPTASDNCSVTLTSDSFSWRYLPSRIYNSNLYCN